MLVKKEQLEKILFTLHPGDRIFLQGTLGAGKTTFAQGLIRKFLRDPHLVVPSPTYTYYQSYPENLHHFDLYRVTHESDILRIGAQEIFDDPESICIIEWPERLEWIITPTKKVTFSLHDEWREIAIENCQA